MPALIAAGLVMLRYIVIALIQSAIFVGAMKLLEPLIDKLKEGIKTTFGLSDDDALVYISNFIIDTVELAGLTVVSLKTKFPLKVADKLGLTGRGFKRGALPAKVSSGANAPGTMAKAAAAAKAASLETVAETTAASKGITYAKVNEVLSFVAKLVGLPVGTLFVIAQFIDYGNWNSGAYQKTFQKILAAITFGALTPDSQVPKASTISDDVWSRVYNTYKEAGAFAINDPYKEQSVVFSRQTLIDLVDKVGSQLNLETGSAPAKAVFAATQSLIRFGNTSVTTPSTGTSTGTVSTPTAVPSIRVFTGVVQQGVLAQGVQFSGRPDDLIESADELHDAAASNLAAALAALPGQMIYEIKIVSSITTKDGFRQTGTTQQVVSGYNTNGTPKYKLVTNKFAQLTIYLLNEKNTRTKVRTIVLGPTNVLKFNPTGGVVGGIEQSLRNDLISSNVSDIKAIATPASSLTTKPESDNSADSSDPYTVGQKLKSNAVSGDPSIVATFTYKGNGKWKYEDTYHGVGDYDIPTSQVVDYVRRSTLSGSSGSGNNANETGLYQLEKSDVPGGKELIYYPPGKTPDASLRAPGAPEPSPLPPTSATSSATTLYEYYSALGLPLPSVATRALKYQELGLGQSAYYTGTAEQNAKLLAALKGN